MDKLFPYQRVHAENICEILTRNNRALDASDTGAGKTYTSVAVAKRLNLRPFIICPKSIISGWRQVLYELDCVYYGISNYELIQNCKFYLPGIGVPKDDQKAPCAWIQRNVQVDPKKAEPIIVDDNGVPIAVNKVAAQIAASNKNIAAKANSEKRPEALYTWDLPADALLIFDEAHKCKNVATSTSNILFMAAQRNTKILMLSATICDREETFALAGYVLGLYPTLKNAPNWINNISKGASDRSKAIHDRIFTAPSIDVKTRQLVSKATGARMRARDLKDLFPQNLINAELIDMETREEIQREYAIIEDAVENIKKQELRSQGLGAIIKARQKIETLKIPTFVELIREHYPRYSVAIFVNFTLTLRTIADEVQRHLGVTPGLVFGEQTAEERAAAIENFMADRVRVIICNIRSGGQSISLHDKHGLWPRMSIISPSYSAIDIQQCFGRIHRAGAKTPATQKLIFASGTIEELICKNIKAKITTIAQLNDGDMLSYQIIGMTADSAETAVPLTERELLRLKLETARVRRDRLRGELTAADAEIADFSTQLAQLRD